jgi:hypothetical protein
MSKFSRLIDLASKSLGKASSSAPQGAGQRSGDWRSMVRDLAETVTGDSRAGGPAGPASAPAPRDTANAGGRPRHGLVPPAAGGDDIDRRAVARYQYLLQTAEPHQVEQIHREAFARLTPAERAQLESAMQAELRPEERPRSSDPADLAHAAARGEARRPGALTTLLSRAGRGGRGAAVGAGVVGAGGLLAAVAGGAVMTAVGGQLLEHAAAAGVDFEALASGVDLEGIASGLGVGELDLSGATEGIESAAAGAGEHLSALGEQAGGWGERISDLPIPGLGDFFKS